MVSIGTSACTPLRRACSVRRTSSIDVDWPEGREGPGRYDARARDLLTRADGTGVVLAEDRLHAVAAFRTLIEIESEPSRPQIAQLVGTRAGGQLRTRLAEVLADERLRATPLYLLLDDMAGATLVSGWAWSRWQDSVRMLVDAAKPRMEGVCIGFRSGSRALGPDPIEQNSTPVESLPHPEDPEGWHPMVANGIVNFRRARRIDVWCNDATLFVESAFQDSASARAGGRTAIHEYRVVATADLATMTLSSVSAVPGTLPYLECMAAPNMIGRILGCRLADLREEVLSRLGKVAGCTHLNDMLRALAEVPTLADAISPA